MAIIKVNDVEKLQAEVERLKKELKKRKKYGLVWEEKLEDVVEMCKEKLPVLKEVKNKEIITGKEKPVNLLIEGDNYHSLSVLNYTHAKKIDVIYIDPPYNTGNRDFIFNDRYVDNEDTYRHSKWLAFMEKRLKLAKNLLKDTGVIFISIDDNEMAQLKLLMDDQNKGLFGENNFLGVLIWVRKKKGSHLSETLRKMTEYILVYKRNKVIPFWGEEAYKNKWQPLLKRTNQEKILKFSGGVVKATVNDGIYKKGIYGKGGTAVTLLNDIEVKNGGIKTDFSLKGRFVWTQVKLDEELSLGTKVAINSLGFGPNVFRWDQLEKFKRPTTLLNEEVGVGTNEDASEELRNIFNLGGDNLLFAYPKPVSLIEYLIKTVTYNNKDAIILDFMAGTGTTGQAILGLNNKDGGNRKFILCTNNEDNNGSGYKIAEDICYPRVKKVIEGYKNLRVEEVEGLGGNLKYFKTDFVDAEPTDRNKIKLTEQATEMLCIKEGTFEKVLPARRSNGEGGDQTDFKIFKNTNHYTGIIFDQAAIIAFKKAIKEIKGKFNIYIFSLGDDTFNDEFEDIKQKVKLSPIPEAILRVYRRIFK